MPDALDTLRALVGAFTSRQEPPTMSDPIDHTSDEALADLETYLCKRFRATVQVKGDSAIMRAVALVFGFAAFFGLNLPTAEEFLKRFATTLGPVIFLPVGLTDPKRRALLLLHEFGHVAGFWEEPLFYPRAYVQSGEKRAGFEALSERGRIEGAWLLYGELPTAEHVHAFMEHGYAVAAADSGLAQQLVDAAATAASSGHISSPVGLAVRDWMQARERGQR